MRMAVRPVRLFQSYAGHHIAVLGLGRSGMACAGALASAGADVVVWDDCEAQRARGAAAGLRVRQPVWGGSSPERLIVSPGIPHCHPEPHPVVADALGAGVAVDNDIGLFFCALAEACKGEDMPAVVAITGSNGKSTTAALLHHLLHMSGKRVRLVGNIGNPVMTVTEVTGDQIIILELSSYQCDLAQCLEPDIAVFLNFSPDHLDRHDGVAGYFAAKQRMFEGARIRAAVVGLDQPEGRVIAGGVSSRLGRDAVTGFTGTGQVAAIQCRESHLSWRRNGQRVRIDVAGCPGLKGQHNVLNAAAVLAVLDRLGARPEDAAGDLMSFPGLPHRSQHVGTFRGIAVINDSKATNAASALQSLRSHPSIRWIAGGRAKEGGIGVLTDHLAGIRKAYLIGEAAEFFAQELTETSHEICETMDRAVAAAVRDAAAGDTILLAPAAASFDQYANFEARGDDFVARIRTCFGAGGCGTGPGQEMCGLTTGH